ncbi:MAG: DNA polymerase IV [Candidatus Omnitrophica bacterium]|nr:DNA polymerase IV [Candidatus Omnitrophota bacterium]
MAKERVIVHVDMDAFFASIEQRDKPYLRGKPVIVGADPKRGKGRGVVSTCSYEARKFGIASAMPISTAYKKCPKAVFLPVDMEKYVKVSEEINEIFYQFTPDIEPVSIDEAFLDITGSFHLFKTPLNTCRLIKSRVKEELDLTCSVGLAPTKMAAKIASDLKKPDGLVVVSEEELLDFLWPLDVGKLPGLGKKSKSVLNDMGIITIGDLAKRSKQDLIEVFGKNGEYFWKLANGKDGRQVEAYQEEKSVSNEITFMQDTLDREIIKTSLLVLCEKVSQRLRQAGLKGRTITLKIRLEDFSTYTRAVSLLKSTNFVDVMYKAIINLFENFKKSGRKVRLLGVKVSNLAPSELRESIFDDKDDDRRERIHGAIEKIREKFSERSIRRAASRVLHEG